MVHIIVVIFAYAVADLKQGSRIVGTGRQVIRSAEKFDIGDNCIQQWNPMESDFLASKNNYAYDEEDASIAVQGYSKYITSIPSQAISSS